MKGEWVRETEKFVSAISYKIGQITVGYVAYDSCTSKDDPKKYKVCCYLPGIKSVLDRYEIEEEGKMRLERAVDLWFTLLHRKG